MVRGLGSLMLTACTGLCSLLTSALPSSATRQYKTFASRSCGSRPDCEALIRLPWSPIAPYVLATFRRLLDHLTSRDRDRGARRGSRSSRVGGCGAIGPNFARMPRKVRMRGDSGSRAVIRC